MNRCCNGGTGSTAVRGTRWGRGERGERGTRIHRSDLRERAKFGREIGFWRGAAGGAGEAA